MGIRVKHTQLFLKLGREIGPEVVVTVVGKELGRSATGVAALEMTVAKRQGLIVGTPAA